MVDIFQESIDERFLILDKIGTNEIYSIYLVKEINLDTLYASMVLKSDSSQIYENEAEILRKLSPLNPEYIEKLYFKGEGRIVLIDNSEVQVKKYLIVDYLPKGELINYLQFNQGGFSELYSKIIFEQILKAVQICHEYGIFHGNLNLESFLLNDRYIPKLYNFQYGGICEQNQKKNGVQKDIKKLAEILLALTCNKACFNLVLKNNKILKKFLKSEDSDEFWKYIESLGLKGLSKEFKSLFMIMYTFNNEKKLDIKNILEHEWFKEIRTMKTDKLKEVKNKLKEDFEEREKLIKKNIDITFDISMDDIHSSINKRYSDDINFNGEQTLKNIKRRNINNSYIKLKGKLMPCKFMNILSKEIKSNLNCRIEPDKNEYKFDATFIEEVEDEDDTSNEDDENDESLNNNIIKIQIKLYKQEKEEKCHIIKFKRKKGYKKNCIDKIEKIVNIIKKHIFNI